MSTDAKTTRVTTERLGLLTFGGAWAPVAGRNSLAPPTWNIWPMIRTDGPASPRPANSDTSITPVDENVTAPARSSSTRAARFPDEGSQPRAVPAPSPEIMLRPSASAGADGAAPIANSGGAQSFAAPVPAVNAEPPSSAPDSTPGGEGATASGVGPGSSDHPPPAAAAGPGDGTSIGAAAASAGTVSPGLKISFAGNNYDTNLWPKPNCSIAAGGSQIITTENSRIQWYDKNGTLQHDESLNSFFGLSSTDISADTRVVYDTQNNRFIVQSDHSINGVNYIGIAVSKTGDPNHGWHFARINSQLTINGQAAWADFPSLATDGEAIYVTAQMRSFQPYGFPNALNDFLETHLWIVDTGLGTGGFYDGGPLKIRDYTASSVTGGSSNFFGLPTQVMNPITGSFGTFLVTASGLGGVIQAIKIDNPTTSASFQSQGLIGAPSTGQLQTNTSQPGTSVTIQSQTLGNSVLQNGILYVVSTVTPISGPDAGVPTVQWERIDAQNPASLKLIDQGTISGSLLGAGPGTATFLPTISANPAGDFLINFAASGPNLYAGSYYAVHAALDPAGTIAAPQPLHVGMDIFALADPNGIVRWGTYNGSVDPVDQNTFWMFHQYAAPRKPGQTGNWGTQIGAVQMPIPTAGGRWIFSAASGGIVLGINNGVAPVFPNPQAGAFNIEVFTSASLAGQPGIPNPGPGFQSSIADAGGTLDSGFLTGTDLRLTTGNLLLVDSVTGAATQTPSKVTLGSGNQTVVGARFDTLVGGSGDQILSALVGNETVIGGTGNVSVWGGANDSIVGGTGPSQQIVLTGSGTTVVAGMGGNATISAAAQDTMLSLGGSTQNIVIAGGLNSLVNLTGNNGVAAVIGAVGDTIVGGSGTTNVEGVSGGMQIVVGAAGITNISGSGVPGLRNTIIGGSGNLGFNPSAQVGAGDLFNLSGSTGNATINAFAFGTARIASPDTILAGNGADSVFGGDGDRIGTGNGSVVGGTHLWDHADPLSGTAVGFGSNDTVASTAYDTVAHTATRHPEIAGTSFATVTVTRFNTATDYLFYQNENAATTNAIIATSQATTVADTPSTVITLPDGTLMTLVGLTQAQLIPSLFKT